MAGSIWRERSGNFWRSESGNALRSTVLRSSVCWRLSRPLRKALARTRGGPPQQSLPLSARRGNVQGAFGLRQPLTARCAAVFDDVMTSGATLDEVARVLKLAGVRQVVNLVVARTE